MAFTITDPRNDAKFPLGEAVEFSGTADSNVARVELTTDDLFDFPTVTLSDGSWSVANRFQLGGTRKVTAKGFDAADTQVANAEVTIRIEVPDFASLVRIPGDINDGVTKARQQTMIEIFGRPGALSDECTAPTNPTVKKLLVTSNVGPFRVTGIKPAVEALTRIFAKVRQQEADLFGQLGTAGMLCCRRIRRRAGLPPSTQFSNHSWGTAIDIKIRGALDPRGDGRTQLGLLMLHPFFNEEKFFWGAGFGGDTEDAMHFEVSDELARQWKRDGVLDV
jgi:hypothetical protein